VVSAPVAVCGYTTSCACNLSAIIIAATAAPLGGSCSAGVPGSGSCTHSDVTAQRGPGLCCVCALQ
jgi:hypothetical protein